MFKNPFSFEGRIRRTEYGLSMLIYVVVYFLVLGLMSAGGSAGAIIGILAFVPLLWFVWAQGAKRCHDLDRSGWFQLIPFYGLFMLFENGQPGRNEYGQNPKEPEQFDQIESETLDGHLRNN